MMFLLAIAEFIILSYLARLVTQTLYIFFLMLTGTKSIALSLTTAILFPGTVIHELSHLFTAELLGVHTGRLTLAPEAIERPHFAEASRGEEEIRSGSVTIAQTDPIRRTIIGLSPVFTGIIAVACISYLMFLSPEHLSTLFHLPISQNQLLLLRSVLTYLLFTIGNTMFSSRQDLKGVIPVFLTIGLFAGAAYLIGIRIGLTGQLLTIIEDMITGLIKSLEIVLAINGVVLLILKVLTVLTGKMLHRIRI